MDLKENIKTNIKHKDIIKPQNLLDIKSLKNNPVSERLIEAYTKDNIVDFDRLLDDLKMFISTSIIDKKLEIIFKVYDADNDGFITKIDLYNVLKKYSQFATDTMLTDIVNFTFGEIGVYEDKIDFTNFKKIILNKSLNVEKKSPVMTEESKNFYKLKGYDHMSNEIEFSRFKGSPLIITNMSTLCGYAKRNIQVLADISTVYCRYGLKILIFPCAQYLKKEEKLETFVDLLEEYSDRFIIFNFTKVFGKATDPIFKHMLKYSKGYCGKFIKWNFIKFLVNENGVIVKTYWPGENIDAKDKHIIRLMKGRKPEEDEKKIIKTDTDPYDVPDEDSCDMYA